MSSDDFSTAEVAGEAGEPEGEASGLPFGLTPRQVKFAEFYIQGGSARDAALAAGYGGSGINVQAHRLKNHPRIQAYIGLLMRGAAGKDPSILSPEQILVRLTNEAMKARSDTARISALGLLMRHNGMLVDKVEDVTKRSEENAVPGLLKLIREIGGDDLAEKLRDTFVKAFGEEAVSASDQLH